MKRIQLADYRATHFGHGAEGKVASITLNRPERRHPLSGPGECIEAEAQAQAICMQTRDFERAYVAFAAKGKPVFEGD